MNAEAFDALALIEPADIPAGLVAPSALATFYAASQAFTSTPADTPANQFFEPRISSSLTVRRSLLSGNNWPAGQAATGWGDLTLENGDSFYDALIDRFAVDGRSIVIKAGLPGSAYSTFSKMFGGTSGGWLPGLSSVSLKIRDPMAKLEVPVQTSLYAGTGGADGGDDLKGKPLPLALGFNRNVQAVLIDAANQVYQVSSRAVKSITPVRDRGATLTNAGDYATYADLIAAAPGLAHYATCLSSGLFRLGYTPQTTENITADVEGDNVGGYKSDTAGILRRLLKDFVGLTDADLDGTSFDQLAYDRPGVVGIWQGAEPALALDLVDALAGGVMGWLGGNRAGLISAGALKPPISTPAFSLDQTSIVSIERVSPPAFLYPPIRRLRVAWGHNYAPSTDIAPSVGDADRAFLLQADRYAAAFSNAVAAAFALAQEPAPIAGLYAFEADALALAQQLIDETAVDDPLFKPGRKLFKVTTKKYLGQIEIGHTGFVKTPDYNLTAGWSGVVLDWEEDLLAGEVTAIMFG